MGRVHKTILRFQSFDALRYLAVINIGAVDLHILAQSLLLTPGGLVGFGQFVMDGDARRVVGSGLQGALIPLE